MAATTVGGHRQLNPEPSQPGERAEHELPPKSYADAVTNGANGQLGSDGDEPPAVNGSAQPPTVNGQNNRQPLDEQKVLYEKHVNHTGETLTSIKPSNSYEDALKHNGMTAPREKKHNRPPKRQDELASGRRAGAGWQTSAIRWAPLNVPLQRRLQTLAVLWHTTTIPLFLSLFFLLCAIPLTWPLLIPYLIYTLILSEEATNGTLSRRSQWMRGSKFWSLFASYFPARLHRTVELQPTRKYIFGYHPHGIISHGAFAAFATEALGFSDLYPGITNTLLTLDTNFRVPFYRDYALAMGLASVSRESIENILCKGGLNGEGMGRAVTIVIGGARESLDAKPHSLRLVLKSRKGFIKLAIRTGADLVPVLAFGENELYDQIDSVEHPWIHKFQMLVKKFMGFTIPLFHARGIFNYDVGLLPYRRAVNVVVGRPIRIVQQGTKDNNVDERYLDQVHKEYVAELVRLWDGYKDLFAQDRQAADARLPRLYMTRPASSQHQISRPLPLPLPHAFPAPIPSQSPSTLLEGIGRGARIPSQLLLRLISHPSAALLTALRRPHIHRRSSAMSSKCVKRNSAPAQFSRDEGSGGEEQDFGMEIDGTSQQLKRSEENLRKSMAIDVGLRKGQRQQRLEKEFENQFHELEAQVDERAERHQQEMRRYRDEILTRLLALTERKAHVEKRIIQAVQELGRAHEKIKQEFDAILHGRSADVREAMVALHEGEKASARRE